MATTSFKAANGRTVEVDATLWNLAHELTSGRGDGRLGIDDAKKLFAAVADDATYSDIEKKTLSWIRRSFKWTERGDETFRTLVRSAAGGGWNLDEE